MKCSPRILGRLFAEMRNTSLLLVCSHCSLKRKNLTALQYSSSLYANVSRSFASKAYGKRTKRPRFTSGRAGQSANLSRQGAMELPKVIPEDGEDTSSQMYHDVLTSDTDMVNDYEIELQREAEGLASTSGFSGEELSDTEMLDAESEEAVGDQSDVLSVYASYVSAKITSDFILDLIEKRCGVNYSMSVFIDHNAGQGELSKGLLLRNVKKLYSLCYAPSHLSMLKKIQKTHTNMTSCMTNLLHVQRSGMPVMSRESEELLCGDGGVIVKLHKLFLDHSRPWSEDSDINVIALEPFLPLNAIESLILQMIDRNKIFSYSRATVYLLTWDRFGTMDQKQCVKKQKPDRRWSRLNLMADVQFLGSVPTLGLHIPKSKYSSSVIGELSSCTLALFKIKPYTDPMNHKSNEESNKNMVAQAMFLLTQFENNNPNAAIIPILEQLVPGSAMEIVRLGYPVDLSVGQLTHRQLGRIITALQTIPDFNQTVLHTIKEIHGFL